MFGELTGASDPSVNLRWPMRLVAEPREAILGNLDINTTDFPLLTELEIRKGSVDDQHNPSMSV